MSPSDKPLRWIGSSWSDFSEFPDDVKKEAGFNLRNLQQNRMPVDWKPMTSVGTGVFEMRISNGQEFRILYVTKIQDAVYVLHAFEKKTKKTRQSDLDLAEKRYRELLRNKGE